MLRPATGRELHDEDDLILGSFRNLREGSYTEDANTVSVR